MAQSPENFRVLQIFLSHRGVFEVSAEMGGPRFHCTCPGFGARRTCKHCTWVQIALCEGDGSFCVVVPASVSVEEAAEAATTRDGFREFVIRYGRVEVL